MNDVDPSPITPTPGTAEGLSAALVVRDVTFGYDPKRQGDPVLSGVSAELKPGRVTVVLGPNACGKSTLLRVMLGQLKPWAGEVELGGEAVSPLLGEPLARRVSYVPQRGEVGFAFTVRQIIAMGRFAFRDEAFVDQAIEKCGLTDVAGRAFNELSGGQQQRVLIARAWAQSQSTPSEAGDGAVNVVLADEPASSLDLRHAHEAMAMFRGLAEQGRAVLVVLHGLELATRWADEVWLMDRGRIVASGSAESVLKPEVLSPVYGLELDRIEHDGQAVLVTKNPPNGFGCDTLEG
ncbi:ABC transporter ATP-binding protein [Algisphaera agarilytica]|uniref:Iron complex transport system ATP-binding protein n=1 Tax=Algisphaera agarilytica TaxID=1385975 RepID=A0A7X0LJI5_9BACT|nr:ABC transporter ATP-binding protein [Algisphaera agarilytica]MBB6428641.1 iron complex transport system ATP-binding protein [Algisphaera agarilytica]